MNPILVYRKAIRDFRRTKILFDGRPASHRWGPKSKLWLVREANSGVFHYTQRYFEEMNIQDKKDDRESNDVIVALLKEGIIARFCLSALFQKMCQ